MITETKPITGKYQVRVEPYTTRSGIDFDSVEIQVDSGHGPALKFIGTSCGANRREMIATANLLARAPDLLAALKKAVLMLDKNVLPHGVDHTDVYDLINEVKIAEGDK